MSSVCREEALKRHEERKRKREEKKAKERAKKEARKAKETEKKRKKEEEKQKREEEQRKKVGVGWICLVAIRKPGGQRSSSVGCIAVGQVCVTGGPVACS